MESDILPVQYRPMSEHRYSVEERRNHLEAFAEALEAASPAISQADALARYAPAFEDFALQAREFLAVGFTQSDLTALANGLPDPLGMRRNPRWEPPCVQIADGRYATAPWFAPIQPKLEAVNLAADTLRTVGYY